MDDLFSQTAVQEIAPANGAIFPQPVEVKVDPASVNVRFVELDDDQVEVNFPAINGSKPFKITLKEMHWGVVADLENIRQNGKDAVSILKFWEDYVVGGPKAVPFKHTFTVFEAIVQYIQHSLPQKN